MRNFVYLADAAFAVNIAGVSAVEFGECCALVRFSDNRDDIEVTTRRDVQALVHALGYHTDDGSKRAMEQRIARKEAAQ